MPNVFYQKPTEKKKEKKKQLLAMRSFESELTKIYCFSIRLHELLGWINMGIIYDER